jgi:predicted DCC family thiol-disulfide oxidoreductase YuxK
VTAGTDAETDVALHEAVVLFDGVCNLCNGLPF